MKRIVIVGGGISGLTAGVYAQKAGFSAEIYEKQSIVGGECTGWDREGYHIDNCIHWMMGCAEGTSLHRIWRDVGAVGEGVEIIRAESMYTSELGGERLTLWADIDRTERELIALSPADEVEIRRLISYAKLAEHAEIPADKPPELMNPLDLLKLMWASKSTFKLFKAFQGMDTNDLMASFKHPLIRCMISDFCTKESLAHSFPMAYGNFTGGDGGVPKGGSRAMARRMKQRFEELGGKTHVNANVVKVDLGDDGKATGITLADGRQVPADYVICACDPAYTFSHLLDESYMDPILREVYANREAYPVYGMFQVAFAVESDVDAIAGDVVLDCSGLDSAPWISGRMSVKTYAYEPSFAPEGRQIVQVLMGLSEDAWVYWSELYTDEAAYHSKKRELAERVQRVVEERFAEYRGKMRILDVWTPVTYYNYCNAFKGYNQAFTITKRSRKNPYPSAYIRGVENVVLAGQWLSPPGGLPGAAIQGKFAVQRILKRERRSPDL